MGKPHFFLIVVVLYEQNNNPEGENKLSVWQFIYWKNCKIDFLSKISSKISLDSQKTMAYFCTNS